MQDSNLQNNQWFFSGGIESMSITEVFGGMQYVKWHSDKGLNVSNIINIFMALVVVLYQSSATLPPHPKKILPQILVKHSQFWFAEFRTGKTQLSHTLCGKCSTSHSVLSSVQALESVGEPNTSEFYFSYSPTPWPQWVLWRQSHVHWHRGKSFCSGMSQCGRKCSYMVNFVLLQNTLYPFLAILLKCYVKEWLDYGSSGNCSIMSWLNEGT